MGVNISFWLIYGVNIHKDFKICSTENEELYDYFEENNMIASYWKKLKDLQDKNTILVGEGHTIFGRVLKFSRDEDGMYGIIENSDNYVVPLVECLKNLENNITLDISYSIIKDLEKYFNIEDKIPKLLFIYHHS